MHSLRKHKKKMVYLNCNYLKGVINKSWMKNTLLEIFKKIIYFNKKNSFT
jgi:NDP-sugar pyrophosphorylase family protein